jgi:hypothetical protein
LERDKNNIPRGEIIKKKKSNNNIFSKCVKGRLIKFIWLMSNEDNYVNKKMINLINNLFSAKKAKYALVGSKVGRLILLS